MTQSSKDTEAADAAGCVFALFWFPALIVLAWVLRGWVLTYLWAWFAVPIFSVPALSIPQAIGVALVVGYLTKSGGTSDCTKEKRNAWQVVGKATADTVAPPLIALLVGYVVRMWL